MTATRMSASDIDALKTEVREHNTAVIAAVANLVASLKTEINSLMAITPSENEGVAKAQQMLKNAEHALNQVHQSILPPEEPEA